MAKNKKMVQTVVRPGQQPTDEQIKEIEAAMAKAGAPVAQPEPETPKQDFTSSLIMKDDEDLPF